jgi:hypothetical protein
VKDHEGASQDRPSADDEKAKRGKRSRKAKRRARAEQAAWRKVLLGLSLVILSVVLTLVLALVGLVVGLFGSVRLLGIIGMTGLAFQVLALVGYGFCLAVPPKHHARTFALATLILAFVGLLVDVGSIYLSVRQAADVATAVATAELDSDDSGDEEAPRNWGAQALNLAKGLIVDYGRHIAFVLFLWAVAQMYEEGNALIRDATQLLVLEGLACAWWAGDTLLSLVNLGFINVLGFIGLSFLCGLGWRLLSLAMLVLFLRLLYNTLIVLQSKATGEPVTRETDAEALRHLPVERPDQLR